VFVGAPPLAAIAGGAADFILSSDGIAIAIEVLVTVPGAAEHLIAIPQAA